MADFQQNGNIAQFHNLRSRPTEEMIYELETFAQSRKISLILPSLFSELEGDALPNILQELKQGKQSQRRSMWFQQKSCDPTLQMTILSQPSW